MLYQLSYFPIPWKRQIVYQNLPPPRKGVFDNYGGGEGRKTTARENRDRRSLFPQTVVLFPSSVIRKLLFFNDPRHIQLHINMGEGKRTSSYFISNVGTKHYLREALPPVAGVEKFLYVTAPEMTPSAYTPLILRETFLIGGGFSPSFNGIQYRPIVR